MSLFRKKMKAVKSDYSDFEAPKEPKSIKNPAKRTVINIVATLLFALVYYYVDLTAINLKSESFYSFLLMCCLVYGVVSVITAGFKTTTLKGYFQFVKKQCSIPFFIAGSPPCACSLVP